MSGWIGPQLVIATGPRSGERYSLRVGEQRIGRAATADLAVGGLDVSRDHARVRWDGSAATVADAGSSSGTVVNGYRILGPHALRSGDVLRLGGTEVRFEASEDDQPTGRLRPAPPRRLVALGNSVANDNAGEIVQAGRDLRSDVHDHTRLDLGDPIDKLFAGRAAGRFLIPIGLLIALAGLAGCAHVILSGLTRSDGIQIPDLFGAEVFGVPAAMVAFGSCALGIVVAVIGKGMSRAAREREGVMGMRGVRAMSHR